MFPRGVEWEEYDDGGCVEEPEGGDDVQCIAGRSKMERVMHLMWSLFFFTARWNVVLTCTHILGVDNGAADAL